MSRVDEFDSFLRSTFADAVQVTYALCGDRRVAREATVDAFRRAWRDWSKIRDRQPLGYVRTEAWRATALSRGTHPLRRRREDDGDLELLDALGALDVDERRLIVLMTLGNSDLEEASREVGVPVEDGIEQVTNALSGLEASLRVPIDQVERRLQALSDVTSSLPMPAPAKIRRAARRGRQRNTIVLVAAAVVGVLGAGIVATDDGALATQQSLPDREKIGSERADVVLDSRKIDTDDLLTVNQISRIDPSAAWKIEGTDDDVTNTTPYATCPTERFADPEPLRVFVRTFASGGSTAAEPRKQRIAQSIEVSSSEERAQAAAAKLIRSFADCEHPRVQLVASYEVTRPFGNFTILRLASNRSPKRTFTVGFSQSGSVTSTVVHETDGTEGPEIEDFAQTLNDSVAKVCKESGGKCSDDVQVTRAEPPRTTDAPSFLSVVDLPPVADVNRVWAASPAKADPNPAATVCDRADFTGKNVVSASARSFVLYQATEVPQAFGVTETVGRFKDEKAAKAFVKKVRGRMDGCPDDNLVAEIDQTSRIKNDRSDGYTWRVGLEVDDDERVFYRVGVVRRGSDVAQVTFTPAGKFDISKKVFTGVTTRAGTRLKYVE